MAKVRLMDSPEDYQKFGVKKDIIEPWEDGQRDNADKNHWEWWYFDAILDDGTTVVVQFLTKSGLNVTSNKLHPSVSIKITLPDGTAYDQRIAVDADQVTFGKENCDVVFGKHSFKGDLKNYTIHVEPVEGLGVDLNLKSLSKPYRPGTAYFEFGDPENYYTWLCAVPKGEVTGTITYNGQSKQIKGFGYHDHQWGSVVFLKEWNYWLWARQRFDDYSMLIFDMTSYEKTGWTRFPIIFIQDKDGNIVFENTNNVTCQVLEEYVDEEASGKTYPQAVHYIFENNGKKVDYTLRVNQIIEAQGFKNVSFKMKAGLFLMGMRPSYSRYLATGELIFRNGNEEIKRSGELIYEFMFPGKTYQGHFDNQK